MNDVENAKNGGADRTFRRKLAEFKIKLRIFATILRKQSYIVSIYTSITKNNYEENPTCGTYAYTINRQYLCTV